MIIHLEMQFIRLCLFSYILCADFTFYALFPVKHCIFEYTPMTLYGHNLCNKYAIILVKKYS
jgi:hypothetical protein